MEYIKERAATMANVKILANFLFLSGLATILPFYIQLQWVTGPLVNAILIVCLFLVGIRAAVLLCAIPSIMALAGGLLPAVLAPMVPFIILGNIVYVLSIDWIYGNFKDQDKGFWTGVFVGSMLKFILLFSSVSIIANLLIKSELGVKVAQILSWPQLATAVAGGMLAYLALKWLKRI